MEIASLIVAVLSLIVNMLMLFKVDKISKSTIQTGGTENQNTIQKVSGKNNKGIIRQSK